MIRHFIESDALTELEPKPATDNPNERYTINLGTWNSLSDVDSFFSRFNHDNNYYDGAFMLRLGDYVTIQDGTYNATWVIAGFDMEHNQKAADGTVYDNGYGICMIPKTQVTTGKWHSNNIISGYKSSTMHTSTLPTIVNNLKNVLGSHIVNRNVLLSSGISTGYKPTYYSNAYTWTTSYATLMSFGQLTGEFGTRKTKYDDGEANYRLPLFNYTNDYSTGNRYWLRNVVGRAYDNFNSCYYYEAWNITEEGRVNGAYQVTYSVGVRPLIYLR